MAKKTDDQQNPQQQTQQQSPQQHGGQGGTADSYAQAQQRQARANDTGARREEDKSQGKLTSELAEPHKGETRYFEGTVTKVDAEGRTVMSDHLAEGERLRRETTENYKASGLDPAAER